MSLLQFITMVLLEVLHGQVMEEGKSQVWFLNVGYKQQMDNSAALWPHPSK